MQDALSRQVAGAHYKRMAIQPFVFTMANAWDPLAHTALKYVARHRFKAGRVDVEKAIHCVDLRVQLAAYISRPPLDVIHMTRFTDENEIPNPDRETLITLDRWVRTKDEFALATLRRLLQTLLSTYDSKESL